MVKGSKKKKMAKKEKKDMNDLKKELEMDEHSVSMEDLMTRLNSNTQTVRIFIIFFKFCVFFYLFLSSFELLGHCMVYNNFIVLPKVCV